MRPTRRIVFSFIALAFLQGNVGSALSQYYDQSMANRYLSATALVSFLGAGVLFAWIFVRGRRMLNMRQWGAILLLSVPQMAGILLSPQYSHIRWLSGAGWDTLFLLTLAMPLWLALLAALQIIPVEVPRSIPAAAIAGLSAFFLVVPVTAVRVEQVPSLIAHLLLLLLTVYSWSFARQHLASVTAAPAAACSLLLNAISSLILSFLFERSSANAYLWNALALPMLFKVAVLVATTWLWFWLLKHMTLAAFSMNVLAMWTSAILSSFVFATGFFLWRVDFAIMIAVTSLVVALRASVEEEQPVALGLAQL